jgi:putative peptidoglycan lipid II flippase
VRESEGLDSAIALAVSLFRISLVLGAIVSILFMIAVPLLSPIIATGFALSEKKKLAELAWYFLPWTLIYVPYYAAAARYKMEWRFNRVFAAEFVTIVVSIAVLALWHDDVHCLPIAYSAGYAAGLLHLLVGGSLLRLRAVSSQPAVRTLLRNIAELFAANQTSNASAVIDRHIQSFVPAGGVAAINYSAQLTNTLASLLTFRDVFAVPLAHDRDRENKLERLLCGLVLLAAPMAGIVVCFAADMVAIVFQRGRFDMAATELTSQVLRISALGLVTGAIFFPLMRTFQIMDRINLTYVLFVTLAISSAAFGYLFVVALQLGVRGVALMQVASGPIVCFVAARLLRYCGLHLNWRRILGYLLFASITSLVAFLAATEIASGLEQSLARLVAGGATYGVIVAAAYAAAISQLRKIAFGSAPP